MSANAAAAAHQHASMFIDARQINLHAMERVAGSISYPGPPAPPPELPSDVSSFVVYDSGSTSRTQPCSRAGAVIDALLERWPSNMRFILLIGGFPALKELAPHLVDSSLATDEAVMDRLRAKLSSKPAWAGRALENLAWSTAPAAKILPWMYIGGFEDIRRPSRLAEMGITHVLVMAVELADFQFPDHICVERIAAYDLPDYEIHADFPVSNSVLDSVRQKYERGESVCILVHCYAGISRSVTVVVAYLMTYLCMSASEALLLVQSRRKGASPNDGFLGQLAGLELRMRAVPSQPPDVSQDES
jgi:predicted protein tyrosine phosphatase